MPVHFTALYSVCYCESRARPLQTLRAKLTREAGLQPRVAVGRKQTDCKQTSCSEGTAKKRQTDSAGTP